MSVVPLSGVNSEVVVTVAWDISWYQYRVLPDSAQPVRLAGRGHEVEELEPSFRVWNARVEADGRVVPEIASCSRKVRAPAATAAAHLRGIATYT